MEDNLSAEEKYLENLRRMEGILSILDKYCEQEGDMIQIQSTVIHLLIDDMDRALEGLYDYAFSGSPRN